MADDRSYQDDEVRAIIERALKAQPDAGSSHDDLLAIGAGVGLSRAALERAALEVREARLNDAAVSRVVSARRRAFFAHAFVFCAVNACLFLINFLTTPGQWWVLFSVFGWGLGLLLHAGFGLGRAVSPARLKRELRRLQQHAGGSASSLLTGQSGGVRVADAPASAQAPDGPARQDETPDLDAPERPSARTSREP